MKKPSNQMRGRINHSQGDLFEKRINIALQWYNAKGLALVDKTPAPMKPIQSMSNGRFLAIFEKKAQPDYKGIVDGKFTVFEAKHTTDDRIQQSAVQPHQAEYLDNAHRLGAVCFILAGFGSGEAYRIPWTVWSSMKERYGRKYLLESELGSYRIRTMGSGILEIFEEV